jgi:hypothetical protein
MGELVTKKSEKHVEEEEKKDEEVKSQTSRLNRS